jgi:hypothetical protein
MNPEGMFFVERACSYRPNKKGALMQKGTKYLAAANTSKVAMPVSEFNHFRDDILSEVQTTTKAGGWLDMIFGGKKEADPTKPEEAKGDNNNKPKLVPLKFDPSKPFPARVKALIEEDAKVPEVA